MKFTVMKIPFFFPGKIKLLEVGSRAAPGFFLFLKRWFCFILMNEQKFEHFFPIKLNILKAVLST